MTLLLLFPPVKKKVILTCVLSVIFYCILLFGINKEMFMILYEYNRSVRK